MSITPEQVQKLIDSIEASTVLAHNISKNYHGERVYEGKKFLRQGILLSFLQRTIYNSTAIVAILRIKRSIRFYDTPLALITRGAILDILLFMTMYIKLNNEKESQEKRLEEQDEQAIKILSDHLCYSWDKMDQNLKDHFLENLPNGFFEDNKPKYKKEDKLGIGKIREILKELPNAKYYEEAIEIYDYLSKYEHFGLFTLQFKKLGVDNEIYFFRNLVNAVFFIQESILLTMGTLDQKEHIEELKSIRDNTKIFHLELLNEVI
jgi:hypothetical protein